ncbi:GNAT family N-acetyltransferase [Enterobacteriaceae bacterium BIT-l23]|uniref:GNAT family N-acetyltransferase n=1 Tax=Jejubacter calystegiae TaxID=2579935 RepID=A0A4P8YHJ8_9ENTR|nr:GNAT family N-acetyltransferase [Jejubacter calystegiae]NUU68472.1 GNAT family N-acetyltransferase [Enterobacteriaceae bacterium BIT-l23]QCT19433.1 GNAT family N-acetyltransferase [Jejubacter calystegiae]
MHSIQPVHIETDRLILRPHHITDFEAWYAMFTDKALFEFISAPTLSPEDGWNRLLRYIGHWSVFGYGLFAIFRKSDGQFLGETGLADFHRGLGDDFDGVPEAAWIISRAAQGQGVAREAAAAAHHWLDKTLSPSRTVCLIDPQNQPSIRIAQGLGYAILGECEYRGTSCFKLRRDFTRGDSKIFTVP